MPGLVSCGFSLAEYALGFDLIGGKEAETFLVAQVWRILAGA